MSLIICNSTVKLEDQSWYKFVEDWTIYTQFDYSGLKNHALELPLHTASKGIVYDNISFEEDWLLYFILPHCDCNHNIPMLIVSENPNVLTLAYNKSIKRCWVNIKTFLNSDQLLEYFST